MDTSWIILIVVIALIYVVALSIAIIILVRKSIENKRIKEQLIKQWNDFILNGQEIPLAAFEFLRQLTLKKYMREEATKYECEGSFVIANYSKKRFFAGESKRIFNSMNIHICGRGNKELYYDIQKNNSFFIKAVSFQNIVLEQRPIIKKKLVDEYLEKGFYKYGKNKPPVEEKPAKEEIDNKASYLNRQLSVTNMVNIVHQPRGGFINPNQMEKDVFDSGTILDENENVHASLIGLAVDYLSRFVMGDTKESSFQISLMGAEIIGDLGKARKYLSNIKGLDDESIVSAIKLVSYDAAFRVGPQAYVDQSQIQPNKETIDNIREMVNRTNVFWQKYGPITVYGPTFEGGYTKSIATGDGDYMSEDTIWDYKVSKKPPTSKHTLQLLLYYLLGKHSIHDKFKEIKYLGIYNPRLNIAYRFSIGQISDETIKYIEKNIIGY